jgi:hypothetical protein
LAESDAAVEGVEFLGDVSLLLGFLMPQGLGDELGDEWLKFDLTPLDRKNRRLTYQDWRRVVLR